MSAFAFDERQAFWCARGAEDGAAHGACDLHGGNAYATAGSVDENGFSAFGLCLVMERVISGAVRNEDTCTLRERDFFGQAIDLGFEREGVLGVGAGDIFGEVDAVAGFYFADALADGFDYACAVGAGRVGELREDGVVAGASVGVGGIDSGGVDFDEDLAGGGLGRGDFFDLHDFGTAEFVDANGFHERGSGSELRVIGYKAEADKRKTGGSAPVEQMPG